MQYKRTNLLTSHEYIGHFNLSHHWSFGDNYSINEQKIQAHEIIKKWNQQQPTNWRYALVENVKVCNKL